MKKKTQTIINEKDIDILVIDNVKIEMSYNEEGKTFEESIIDILKNKI